MNNISLYETNQGGDFEFSEGDIQTTGAIWTMVYVAWFGGNPDGHSEDKTTPDEFNKDYWGNKLFYPNNPEKQINSRLEKFLRTIALTSSNLTKIERVAINDLKHLSYLGDVTVEASLVDVDKLQLTATFSKKDGLTNEAIIIWDATEKEPLREVQDVGICSPIAYGRLYNGYVAQHANIAPVGWHVPSPAEIATLKSYLATDQGSKTAGFYDLWLSGGLRNNVNFGITGINVKPSGYRVSFYGYDYFGMDQEAYAWQNDGTSAAWWRNGSTSLDGLVGISINSGCSILLLKDDSDLVDSFSDVDGNTYGAVKIGTQVWATEFFVSTKLNDGTPIQNVANNTAWSNLTTLAYCNYDNDLSNVFGKCNRGVDHGYLYNHPAYAKPSFAPDGWRVPTSADLAQLESFLSFLNNASALIQRPNTWLSGDLINTAPSSVFDLNIIGTGYRGSTGLFFQKSERTYIAQNNGVGALVVNYGDSDLTTGVISVKYGVPLRLIKEDSIDPGSVTDFDGNVYGTVNIAGQIWTTESFACTHYNDGIAIGKITDAQEWANDINGAFCAYDNIETEVFY